MKAIRVLAVAAALCCAAVVAPSCSPVAPKCNLSNCNGCCDSTGQCQTGKAAAACGKSGNRCDVCVAPQVCGVAQTCVPGNTGGGAGGGGGSGGSGGGVGGGGTGGTGGTGGLGGAGGFGGAGGSGGFGGAGGGAAQCNSTNCPNGCCGATGCVQVAAQTNAGCGNGGQVCLACTSGNNCTGGACVGQSCSAANCPSGCCNGNACVAYAQQTNGTCGVSGAACAACPSGQTCATGVCTANAQVGSPCTTNNQCSSLGAGAYCKLTTSTANGVYPQGMCTKPCTSFLNCPLSAECIGGQDSVLPYYGEYDKFCAPSCPIGGIQLPCRTGYFCYDLSVNEGTACWLDNVPPFDGGGFPDKLGIACTADTQCANPPSPDFGFCQPPVNPNTGNNTGFTAGYCMADCTLDNTDKFCGNNGECFGFNNNAFYLCIRTCSTPGQGYSTLRAGNTYTCRRYTQSDGGTSKGYLWPACTQPGNPCPTNTFCNTSNGYCCDGGFCLN